MKPTSPTKLAAAVLALSASVPMAAYAQSDAWEFQAAIYGWFPAISGTTSFPPTGGGPSIDVSMRDVLDALKFTFMGNFEARKGAWGVWTDLVYADFGASKQGSRDFTIGGQQLPVGVDANLVLDIKSWIWTLAGQYTVRNDADVRLDVLAGARLIDMQNTLSWSLNGSAGNVPLPPQTGSSEVTVSNWDAIAGVKGRLMLGADRKWFVPYYADIGTGQSKLTWQVNAGIGYQFGWGAMAATWRYLDYDFKDGSKITGLSFSGPVIGAAFKF